MRQEEMDALNLLLSQPGLTSWEDKSRVENALHKMVRQPAEAQRSHKATPVASKVSMTERQRLGMEKVES